MASGVPAICRRDRQSVVVVDMARSAGHVGMAIGQQEARRAVIELRAQPTIKGVARFAGSRKLRTDVVGIRSPLKILQVARRASR